MHAPILLLQIGSESNIGSTLVVPYSFDPEFWSGCSSSVGGTGTFQSKNCDKSKLTSISKGGGERASERLFFFWFYQLFGNFIVEPTGSGQIERERESPVLFEDSNKSCPTWDVHSDMLYWMDTYLILKKTGGLGWENTRSFFARNLFKNNIYQRY